jgi:glucan phosphoethanolaminetransferase (alkaline phosphatase superfamily)
MLNEGGCVSAAAVGPGVFSKYTRWVKPLRIPAARAARVIGPNFVAAALIAPNAIAVFNSPSLQYALLMTGLSLALVSLALAVYHWTFARRLLHLSLYFILLELFYRIAYGGGVSSGVLLSVPETSDRETAELLGGHAILTSSLSLVALLTLCALVVSWKTEIRFSPRRCVQAGAFSAMLVAASIALGGYQFGQTRLLRQHIIAQVEGAFPFDVTGAFGAVALGWIDTRRQASRRADFQFPNVRLVNADLRGGSPEIYVVVIGETSRRTNWSLFGYPRATTPRLDAIRNDLVLFDHVTSNATTTILSVPLALTRAAPSTSGVARSEKSIVTLLKQAGFETFWISNQERPGVGSSPISQIAFEADHVSFSGDIQAGARSNGFDSNLLARFDAALARQGKAGKAVIFLHMEGSHFAYEERYPADFTRFRDGREAPRILPQRQSDLVDEYDNSVSFTDDNVREVIDRLNLCGCRAGLVFFSDHGERLFDKGSGDTEFGHGFPTVSRQEIEVPFFLWLSQSYQEANASPTARLKNNAQSVAQLHNLFETIADLAGVDYDRRAAALSLFSDKLESPGRLEVLNMQEETVTLDP